MDQVTHEEIISVLAIFGRADLVQEFREHVKIDSDYQPPKFMKKDTLSDSEGSAVSEEEYEIDEDEDGFKSLK